MLFNDSVWQSKTHGKLKLVIMLSCLALIIPALVLVFFGAQSDDMTFATVTIVIATVIILGSIAVVLIGARSDLKWYVSNLIFAVDDTGLYFTTPGVNSYFNAEWHEIKSYSAVTKGDHTTVTVNFSIIADAGYFGKLKRLKMVNIQDFATLRSVFEANGIPEESQK